MKNVIYSVLGLGVIGLLVYAGSPQHEAEVHRQAELSRIKPRLKPSTSEAYVAAQKFVEQKLKAPGTAEFQGNVQGAVKQVNDTTFLINSWVDSQNGFGAKLRSNYSCEIVYSGQDIYCNGLNILP